MKAPRWIIKIVGVILIILAIKTQIIPYLQDWDNRSVASGLKSKPEYVHRTIPVYHDPQGRYKSVYTWKYTGYGLEFVAETNGLPIAKWKIPIKVLTRQKGKKDRVFTYTPDESGVYHCNQADGPVRNGTDPMELWFRLSDDYEYPDPDFAVRVKLVKGDT